MKTLTIKQPWASLVCTPRPDNILLGIKDIENRTWRTDYRGRIGVHASQAWNTESAEICISNPTVKAALEKLGMIHDYKDESIGYNGYSFSGFEHGAIIGEVDIIDCVQNHPSIWAMPDHWNWVLANPVLYDEPILNVKGKQSFWEYRP